MIRLAPAAVVCAALAAVWLVQAAAQSAPQPDASSSAAAAKQPAPARSAAAGGSAVRDADASSRLFRELDRNGDGYLSPDELKSEAALRNNWIAVDRNRDGRISRSEFEAVGTR